MNYPKQNPKQNSNLNQNQNQNSNPNQTPNQNENPKQEIKRNSGNYFNLSHTSRLGKWAAGNRRQGNLSEAIFWGKINKKKFKGLDFDRQKIIGNYIIDFYCANCNVVVEIDGESHDHKQEYDAIRDSYLKGLGFTVIHIADIDVKKNLEGVMAMLDKHPAFEAFVSEGRGVGRLAVRRNGGT